MSFLAGGTRVLFVAFFNPFQGARGQSGCAGQAVLDAARVSAGIIVLSAFVVVLDAIVDRAENRLVVWRPSPAHEPW
ncbi:hypothetical protein QCM77_32800 [Bradyrhizobium sp. SSUT18]|uniref:hypothetical protein n=1 Tax=Bradyrhizobium sp. SSUT18 TaxID=3040602 RepID=UPI00244B586A|nr:hypothetical protein [Bradyrhizobium sp. SSUT18]MDH2404687.1 hypothetical protein [Bradyrhizobium sp. SSUT18]